MTPSIGRIVHFHDEGGPYAALITALNEDGSVELVTFGRNSVYFQHSIQHSEHVGGEPGTWTWPPRV